MKSAAIRVIGAICGVSGRASWRGETAEPVNFAIGILPLGRYVHSSIQGGGFDQHWFVSRYRIQQRPNLPQRAIKQPRPEVAVEGWPGLELRGQLSPGAARLALIMNRCHDATQIGVPTATSRRWRRQERGNAVPLRVAQLAPVRWPG